MSIDEVHSQSTSDGKAFAKWRARSVDCRSKLGMSATARPWTGLATTRLAGRRARYLDAIDVCFMEASTKKKSNCVKTVAEGLWCNPSQNVGHSCKPCYNGPGTFCRSGIWYSFEQDATLSGAGQLALLGWPASYCPMNFSEAEARSLSGDGFSVPVAAAVATSCWLNPWAPWWPKNGSVDVKMPKSASA